MQPKLSILIIARRRNSAGDTEYLCQERQRQPFYGFWGAGISGPILWGESHKEASARELLKQAGMQAARFSEVLFYRQRDYSAQTQLLLEDKLFILVEATNYTIVKKDTWAGGSNAWLTLPELEKKPKHFSTLRNALHAQEAGESFVSHATLYEADEY